MTVWLFPTAEGAAEAGKTLEDLQRQESLQLHDAAIVSFPEGARKPKTRQLSGLTGAGALGGAFWGMLFGHIFFVPLLGMAVGAGIGALTGSMADVGIDDAFIRRMRDEIQPGTSALFVLSSGAVVERVNEAFTGRQVMLVETSLSHEHEDRLRDVFAGEEELEEVGARLGREHHESAGRGPDLPWRESPGSGVFREPPPGPIVLGGGGTAPDNGGPTAPSPGAQPAADDTGAEEETADGSPDEQRHWLVDVKDYDQEAGLAVGEERVVTLSVGADASAIAAAVFNPEFMDAAPKIQLFVLTVQVASGDFMIPDEDLVQTLPVPRTGPSRKSVTWRVTPRHDGPCTLTATVDYRGNFLTQLDLTVPAHGPGPVELTTDGRSPESVATLEGRDLFLVVRPAPPGYDLTVGGSVYTSAHMPVTDTELAYVVDDVQKALFQVVSMTNDQGEPVFQYGIDIPKDISARALETLARAGALLFNQIFFHADSGEDLQEVGRFLKNQANQPDVRLKIMMVSADAPVPWPMLYVGDTAGTSRPRLSLFLAVA